MSYTLKELEDSLIKADAAGNTDDAQFFADKSRPGILASLLTFGNLTFYKEVPIMKGN